jgi:hypothetical protein
MRKDRIQSISFYAEINGSNIIKAVGYESDSEKLAIQFFNNQEFIYEYKNVPLPLFLEFINSDSIGSFFMREIRNKFEWIKVKAV